MNILLVNDDGIHSDALKLLCRAAAARGHRVLVCAPSTQQSGKSHCFTIFQPLTAHPVQMEGAEEAWAVDGTPVDCTRLGLMAISREKIDLVISGINYGWNAGLATYVSGTVGAAREAAFQEVRAMAVSMAEETPAETQQFFAEWIMTAADRLMAYDAPRLSVCNLNVPGVPLTEIKPPVMCPISTNIYRDSYARFISPRGDSIFALTPEIPDDRPAEGTDVDMLNKGHITCTFLTPEPCEQSRFQDFLDEM